MAFAVVSVVVQHLAVAGTEGAGAGGAPDQVVRDVDHRVVSSKTTDYPVASVSVLFVDQVGSTAQLSTLGENRGLRVRERLCSILDTAAQEAGATGSFDTGDGMMAVFAEASPAARCALDVHRSVFLTNRQAVSAEHLGVRIGIHTAEMPHRDGVPVGIGVAVAARLCASAGQGQTFVSDGVRTAIETSHMQAEGTGRRVDERPQSETFADFVAIGSRRLRGIAEPLAVHQLHPGRTDSEAFLPPGLAGQRREPFVGRDAELDRLRLAIHEGWESRGPGVTPTFVVAGDVGIGRRRLVAEFAVEMVERGFTVVWRHDQPTADLARTNPASGDVDIVIVEGRAALDGVRPGNALTVVIVEGDPLPTDPTDRSITLGPITPDEVTTLVNLSTGGAELDGRIAAEIQSVGGHPGRIRMLLDEQLSVEAARRARRLIADASANLRDGESGMSAVTNDIRGRFSPVAFPDEEGRPPYKGLVRFEAVDAALFCGRDQLVAEILGQVGVHGFVLVTGSSGSGKSSLVRAGVLPALVRDALPLSSSWMTAVMTPGHDPFGALADALAPFLVKAPPKVVAERLRTSSGLLGDLAAELTSGPRERRLFLVIDQAEELFTLTGEIDRASFLEAIAAAIQQPRNAFTAVVVMRSDFYGRVAEHRDFADLAARHHSVVSEMSRSDLEVAISEPARRTGLELESGLVELVLDEAGNEVGALPLVSTAMLETWRRREDSLLTLAGFERSGGVHGAVAQLAEDAHESLSEQEQSVAQRILVALTEPSGAATDTSRPLRVTTIHGFAVEAPAVLEKLTANRLVTVREDVAELSHEALIVAWPRFSGWLDDGRAARRSLRMFASDAARWDQAERSSDLLRRGLPLEEAESTISATDLEVSHVEREFLDASLARRQAEENEARRSARRVRTFAVGLAVLLGVALVAGGLALRQRSDAQKLAKETLVTQTAELANSLGSTDPRLSFLLAIESLETEDRIESRRAVLSASTRLSSPSSRQIKATSSPIDLIDARLADATVNDDVTLVAVASFGDEIQVFDTVTMEPTSERMKPFDGGILALAFGPSGWLAALGPDRALVVWDESHAKVGQFQVEGTGEFVDLGWLNGTEVIVGSADGTVDVVDVENGQRTRPPVLLTDARVTAISVASETTAIVGGDDGTMRVIDLETAEITAKYSLHNSPVIAAAVSRQGDIGASAVDGGLTIWRLADGEIIAGPIAGPTRPIRSLDFSPDGMLIVAGAFDETVRVWDVANGQEIASPLNELTDNITTVAFTPDSSAIVAVSEEGQANVWSVELVPLTEEPRALPTDMTEVRNLAFSPDGELLVAVGNDGIAADRRDVMDGPTEGDPGRVVVYDVASGDVRHELIGHDGAVNWAAFSQNGALATASHDGTVRLWDVETGDQVGAPFVGHDGPVLSVVFDPRDDDRIVTSGADGTIRRWSRATGTESGRPMVGHGADPTLEREGIDRLDVVSVSFSEDGALLASAGFDNTARVWETTSWTEVAVMEGHHGRVRDALFLPTDQGILATASFDKTVRLWDVESSEQLASLDGHTFLVIDLAATSDGAALVSSSWDNTIRLWDPELGVALGAPLARHEDLVWRIALDPQSRLLATAGLDGQILLWPQLDVGFEAALGRACGRAASREEGPNMTPAEWHRYIGEAKPYSARCTTG